MHRFIFIILFIFLHNIPCIAQKEGNIWVFGDSAAIDFNSANPVPFLGTGLLSQISNRSISNQNGQLLFYTGAYTFLNNGGFEGGVFNKYNKLIQNGTGLYSCTQNSQSNLLLPFVEDTNKFYLFTNRGNPASDLKIYYSMIDKTSNSVRSDVLTAVAGADFHNPCLNQSLGEC